MQLEFSVPGFDPDQHVKGWIAKVTSWPDNSPPALSFGRRVKNVPGRFTLEAGAGDIVRWGARNPATGEMALEGWTMIGPSGNLLSLSKAEAQARRRAAHPEDATAAPTRTTFRRGRRGATPAPAQDPAPIAPAALARALSAALAERDQLRAALSGLADAVERLLSAQDASTPAVRGLRKLLAEQWQTANSVLKGEHPPEASESAVEPSEAGAGPETPAEAPEAPEAPPRVLLPAF